MRKLTAQEALERLNLPKMRGESDYTLVYTRSDDNGNSIYVFSKPGSHIITTSAEVGISPIIGGEDEEFIVPDLEEELDALNSYLDSILQQVNWADNYYEKLPIKYKKEVQLLTRSLESNNVKENIQPLIGVNNVGQRTYWDNLKFQGNVLTQYIVPGTGYTSNNIILGNDVYQNLAGCGGTALSIIVKYWLDPTKHTITLPNQSTVLGYKTGCETILPYNCKQRIIRNGASTVGAEYNIPKSDSITVFNSEDIFGNSSSKKKKAMAELFEYVTKACRTAFGPPGIGSSAALSDILYAIKGPLGFSPTARIIKISETENAVDKIYAELEAGRPVIMSGYNSVGSGHTYIVDGYCNSIGGVSGDYFHTILNTTTNAWYSLTPTTTTGVTHNWSKDLKAIIGIQPRRVSSGIIGDVNGDGLVNMSDLTEVLHNSIIKGKQLREDLIIIDNSEGIQFTGRVDGQINKLFFPLTGWKRATNGVAYEKYSEGCYITTSGNSNTITRILRDGSTDEHTSNLFACVRLVYKGNNPTADGAVDLGYYQTVNGSEGPERKKLYFAPMNIGAESQGDTGVYFKKSTFSLNSIASEYNINTNKWRLPTHKEIQHLFESGYMYLLDYDVNRDGFIDMEDINFIVNKILGKFYQVYHSSDESITEHSEKYMLYGDNSVYITETTDIFKDFVKPECYYGGFYKRRWYKSEPFDPYTIDNASQNSMDLVYNSSYDASNGYGLSAFYINEVPKLNTVPIIIGTNFTAIPWPTPLTGASITVGGTTFTGSFSDSIQVTNGTSTETLQNYIVFETALTQEGIVENGITITTLDGVDVELSFTNNDFNSDYSTWSIVTQ